MDLLLLAPDLQETLLFLPAAPGRDPIHLRELRYLCQTPIWAEQRERWAEIGVMVPMPVPRKMAMPGSILERTSSGETTLYFHMNFHLFYLYGLHVKVSCRYIIRHCIKGFDARYELASY